MNDDSSAEQEASRDGDAPQARETESYGDDAVGNRLERIKEISQNARTTWFAMLALLIFVGVTLMGHRDSDFFTRGVETQLPVVGVSVPTANFFFAAPVLVMALYAYLNLYLLALWDVLGRVPARIGGEPLGDRVFPTLISQAAITFRNRARRDGSITRRALDWTTALFSTAMIWAFALIVLAVLWWRSMAAHDEGLTLWIGLWLWAATVVGCSTFLEGRRRLVGRSGDRGSVARTCARLAAIFLVFVIASLSWLRTEGGFERYQGAARAALERIGVNPERAERIAWRLPTTQRIAAWTGMAAGGGAAPALAGTTSDTDVVGVGWLYLYPTNLREAQLTTRPDDWRPFDLWRADFEQEYRQRGGLGREAALPDDFTDEVRRRYLQYLSALDSAELRGADLRFADLTGAFLPGSDLREARLEGAVLDAARLQGADLSDASLQWADFEGARMQAATLAGAKASPAAFESAELQHADLTDAQISGSVFTRARLDAADLSGAEARSALFERATMRGALLDDADLTGADLESVGLQDASLASATLANARFVNADMSGANLWGVAADAAGFEGAVMDGVDLTHARLNRADLRQVSMREARLLGTSIDEAVLTLAQMNGSVFQRMSMRRSILVRAELPDADIVSAASAGAVLIGANLQGAQLRGLDFRGVILSSATLADASGVTQSALQEVVGNEETILPPDGETGEPLFVWSCWKDPPESLASTLDRLAEVGALKWVHMTIEDLREDVLCDGRGRQRMGAR